MTFLDWLMVLRPWLLLAILGLLVICFARAAIKREEAYKRMLLFGRLEDRLSFMAADSRFVGIVVVLVAYASLGMAIQLIPLPFR